MEIADGVVALEEAIVLQFLKPFKSSSTTAFELVECDARHQKGAWLGAQNRCL